MKVYMAAPYVMKELIKARAAELRALGIEVTSSWLEEKHAPNTQMAELPHEDHQKYALADVEDVLAGDVLVFHTDPTKTIIRAGRHVEFGMAVMIGRVLRPMPIFVVGEEEENIFHHLPQVYHGSWEKTKAQLIALRDVQLAETDRDYFPFQ